MEITGPFLDRAKQGQPKPWYLRYSAPKLNSDGTAVLGRDGKPVLQRHRPYYPTKAKAEADKPRIQEQIGAAGTGRFLFDRAKYRAAVRAQAESEKALDPAPFTARSEEKRRESLLLVSLNALFTAAIFFFIPMLSCSSFLCMVSFFSFAICFSV